MVRSPEENIKNVNYMRCSDAPHFEILSTPSFHTKSGTIANAWHILESSPQQLTEVCLQTSFS